jgi:hypothetical protein
MDRGPGELDEYERCFLPHAGLATEPRVAGDFSGKAHDLRRQGGWMTAWFRGPERWVNQIILTLEQPEGPSVLALWVEGSETAQPWGGWARSRVRANGTVPRPDEPSVFRLDWPIRTEDDFHALYERVTAMLAEFAGSSVDALVVRFEYRGILYGSAAFMLGCLTVPVLSVATAVLVGLLLAITGSANALHTAIFGGLSGLLLGFVVMNVVPPTLRSEAGQVPYVRRGQQAERIMTATVLVGPVVLTLLACGVVAATGWPS